MNEPGDNENDSDKVAKTLARESHTSKDIIIKNIDKTQFCVIPAIFVFSLTSKKWCYWFSISRVAFTIYLFIYLFIFKFLVFLLTKNYHFCNFFFCVTFAYFSVNSEIQLTHLLID